MNNIRKKLIAGGLALSVISTMFPVTGCNSIKDPGNSKGDAAESVRQANSYSFLNVSKNKTIADPHKDITDNHYDCIVLGGGIAGVTAAKELKKLGKEALILEAKDYIGGRMHSIHDFTLNDYGNKVREGYPIEEGAHYIHVGRKYKEFWDEVDKYGFRTESHSKATQVRVSLPEKWNSPKSAWLAYITNKEMREVGNSSSGIYQKIKEFDLNEKDMPAGKFVKSLGFADQKMAKYAISAHTPGLLSEKGGQLIPKNHPIPIKLTNDNISVAGLKVDNIPEQLRDELKEYKLKDANGGCPGIDALPKAMANEFVQKEDGQIAGKVLLQHEVVKVEEMPDGKVIVTAKVLSDKNKSLVEFTADSVVCTFSAGVLRHKGRAIFGEKFFPEAKQEAFDVLQMGPLATFSMQFKEPVWNKSMSLLSNPNGANPINPEEHGLRTFFSIFPKHPWTSLDKYKSIFNQLVSSSVSHSSNGPHVLTALIMGSDYMAIKGKTEDEAAKYIFEVIEGAYNPNYKTERWNMEEKLVYKDGKPNVHFKDWGADPFTRGGNSFLAFVEGNGIKDIKEAREKLKKPVPPVFFCGEATAPAYNKKYQPLAIHGAYISGVESAKDVVKYLEDNGSFEQYYKEKYDK